MPEPEHALADILGNLAPQLIAARAKVSNERQYDDRPTTNKNERPEYTARHLRADFLHVRDYRPMAFVISNSFRCCRSRPIAFLPPRRASRA